MQVESGKKGSPGVKQLGGNNRAGESRVELAHHAEMSASADAQSGAGGYESSFWGERDSKLQIVTIGELQRTGSSKAARRSEPRPGLYSFLSALCAFCSSGYSSPTSSGSPSRTGYSPAPRRRPQGLGAAEAERSVTRHCSSFSISNWMPLPGRSPRMM